ncbi:hypothetical protein KKB55_16425 [Myxococcota bacterium]|nr:hypothetical protein [Myxococcota bacterium]MBU1899328.1 hypothetical protein [Myxococcota bacterium]
MKRLLVAFLVLGCAAGEEEVGAEAPAFADHEEASDFVLVEGVDEKADGIPARFDPNWIMSDAFFTAAEAVSADDLQAIFEETPYGQRCWLADEQINGRRAADAIAEVARETGINPLLLLTRMQVEKSLISKTARPSSQHSVDYALGCGCPDNRSCMSAYKGLDKQVKCAGDTLRKLYDASVDGTGQWRAGKRQKSLDPEWITPGNHATAAFYGYTPWVLRNRGGNWLVWNVTRKFSKAVGQIALPGGCLGGAGRPFIGAPCGCPEDCAFQHGDQTGVCHPAGLCTLPCEGTCPDASGYASTFCAAASPGDLSPGLCLPKPESVNHGCADLPNTEAREVDRYIGGSGASARTAEVCFPLSGEGDVEATPCEDDDGFEPNDTPDRPARLGHAPLIEGGLVACPSSPDHYSLTLPDAGPYKIIARFTHRDGDVDLFVYRDGQEIGRSDGTGDEEAVEVQGGGEVTLKVVGLKLNHYTLHVEG